MAQLALSPKPPEAWGWTEPQTCPSSKAGSSRQKLQFFNFDSIVFSHPLPFSCFCTLGFVRNRRSRRYAHEEPLELEENLLVAHRPKASGHTSFYYSLVPAMTMSKPPPLSSVLPPLILGTATFNTQYHPDPTRMPYTSIVQQALLTHGIAAFDTSPYYGPSETLLGDALETINEPRASYFLITKAGRIAADTFDYSPAAIRASVRRSLDRLRSPYLDLVYAHDVEFVTPEEVLSAVRELRRLRDEEGLLRYVGISGYPVDVLASLAEMILIETGEPLDAVLSYSHFCVQNTRLGSSPLLQRFQNAAVECVLNASMLSMGLLTRRGADGGPMASWHPAPPELRQACQNLQALAAAEDENIEKVAIEWALDNWAREGSVFGTNAIPIRDDSNPAAVPERLGVSVMGVTSVAELDETWRAWRSIAGLENGGPERARRRKIGTLVEEKMWPSLGKWKDFTWTSGLAPGHELRSEETASVDLPERHEILRPRRATLENVAKI